MNLSDQERRKLIAILVERLVGTEWKETAQLIVKQQTEIERLTRGRDDAIAKVAELEAERNAWQSLDGINWYQRAKVAESEIERLTQERDRWKQRAIDRGYAAE